MRSTWLTIFLTSLPFIHGSTSIVARTPDARIEPAHILRSSLKQISVVMLNRLLGRAGQFKAMKLSVLLIESGLSRDGSIIPPRVTHA